MQVDSATLYSEAGKDAVWQEIVSRLEDEESLNSILYDVGEKYGKAMRDAVGDRIAALVLRDEINADGTRARRACAEEATAEVVPLPVA